MKDRPKYLTISDDLQLIRGEGSRFLSKSGKSLDATESEALEWLDRNPEHSNREAVEEWLDDVANQRTEQKRSTATELAVLGVEKALKKLWTAAYRDKGWPIAKAREAASRKAREQAPEVLEALKDL